MFKSRMHLPLRVNCSRPTTICKDFLRDTYNSSMKKYTTTGFKYTTARQAEEMNQMRIRQIVNGWKKDPQYDELTNVKKLTKMDAPFSPNKPNQSVNTDDTSGMDSTTPTVKESDDMDQIHPDLMEFSTSKECLDLTKFTNSISQSEKKRREEVARKKREKRKRAKLRYE